MKLLLFALTGMGNEVLKSASRFNVITDIMVITRQEPGPYPYFPCRQLDEYCDELGISCRHVQEFANGSALVDYAREVCPDLIVSATFNKILPTELIGSARIEAVNFHPSLLPFYRGPNPTNWVLVSGELRTGLTVHRLTPEVDNGDVLLQEEIETKEMNDGELRRSIFGLAGRMFVALEEMIARGEVKAAPMAKGGSIYPGIASPKGLELLRSGRFAPENVQRGLTPYPGLEILDLGAK